VRLREFVPRELLEDVEKLVSGNSVAATSWRSKYASA
jgi:hypothetical protein